MTFKPGRMVIRSNNVLEDSGSEGDEFLHDDLAGGAQRNY